MAMTMAMADTSVGLECVLHDPCLPASPTRRSRWTARIALSWRGAQASRPSARAWGSHGGRGPTVSREGRETNTRQCDRDAGINGRRVRQI